MRAFVECARKSEEHVIATRIASQRKKIAAEKAKLEMKGKLLQQKARKLRVKKLIELGGLLSTAGFEEMDAEAILGALLELKRQAVNQETVNKWTCEGREVLQASKNARKAVILVFELEPSNEVKARLRQMGMKWNAFRREWCGYGKKEEIQQLLNRMNVHAQISEIQD